MKTAAVCAALLLITDHRALLAQQIEIGILFSTQGANDPTDQSPSTPRPGVGGSAFGVVAGWAFAVSPKIDFAIEASVPTRFSGTQLFGTYGYDIFTENRHRDLIVTPLVRFHPARRASDRVRFEAVVGGGLVWENTVRQSATLPIVPSGPLSPFSPDPDLNRLGLAVVGGGNLEFVVGTHVSIVPEGRVYGIVRSSFSHQDSYFLGLSSWVFRAALNLRTTF